MLSKVIANTMLDIVKRQEGFTGIPEYSKLINQGVVPERMTTGAIFFYETDKKDITHLITVSCTGMSAPGLDLDIAQAMQLSPEIVRTSVNFMGCYAAVHALQDITFDVKPGEVGHFYDSVNEPYTGLPEAMAELLDRLRAQGVQIERYQPQESEING